MGISKWINSTAFFGIILTIIVFWMSCCAFSMMAQIQCPRILLEKDLDWGKVEKVEE